MDEIRLRITQDGLADQLVAVNFDHEQSLESLAERITEVADLDGYGAMDVIFGVRLDGLQRLSDGVDVPTDEIRLHRVRVQVHFETEVGEHWFPAESCWAHVHRWACNKFTVAAGLCANLELRASGPNGPPLNERNKVGDQDRCRVVWLVKPGPEENG